MQPNTLNFQVGGDFSYNDTNNNFVWHTNNSLVVLGSAFITVDDFSNRGRIDVAGNFNVTAGDDFFNRGRIDVADNFDVLAGDDFYNWYGAIINADNFNVLTGDRFYNLQNSNINANDFNVVAGGLFANRYDSNINTNNNFNVTAGDNFYNTDNATVSANALTISANSFVNNHTRGDGNINADTLNLSLVGDFDYAADYLGNGNINATTLNFQVGGDFSYNDPNHNFVWDTNNSLVVLGSASFNVDDFSNRGEIDVANDLTISTNSFVNTYTDGDGNINADTLTLSLIGDFDYAADYLGNGNIKTTTLNLQVGGDFSYNDTNSNFVWHTNNSLVVLGSASL